MRRLGIFALLVVIALAGTAEAGRKDDFKFAERLVQRKYYDLARAEFEKIIADTDRSPTERADGELGLALLLKAEAGDAQADNRKSIEDVLKVLNEAEGLFDAFLEKYPSHPKRTDAKFEVGSLLQMKGDFISRRIEDDPTLADSFRATAEEAFDQAIDLFRDVAERMERKIEEDDPEDPEQHPLAWALKKAKYFYAVTHYSKGMLYPEGSAERAGILEDAVKVIDDFVWENEDNILGGYAYLFYGLTKAALDDPDGAVEMMVSATNYQVPDPQKYPRDYAIWTELILKAYYKLGEYCNQVGKRGDTDYREIVIRETKNMLERIPGAVDLKWGHFALIEYARAQMGLGNYAEAKETAALVSRKGDELSAVTDWGEATAYYANRLLNEIIAEAEGVGVDLNLPPADLFKAALGKQTSQDYAAAIRAYQSVIRACTTDEQKKEFLGKAWMRIGSCYYAQEKFLEAFFAYTWVMKNLAGYQDEEGQDLAGSGAYWRYRCASQLFAVTGDKEDGELKKRARSEFASKFPDHPRSIDLQYYEGADFISDGDARLAAGDRAGAEERFHKALERLESTKNTSILYAKALSRWGEVLYKLGKYPEALAKFKDVRDYIADPENVVTNPNRKANRVQALAIAAYYGGQCYGRLGQWDRDLAQLEDFEKKFADEGIRNFFPHVKFERLRALVELGRLDEAEKEGLALRREFPDSVRTPIAFSFLGKAFHEAAMAAKNRKDEELHARLLEKAAEYYTFYLSKRPDVPWHDWQMIGVWYYNLGDWAPAEEYLEKALQPLKGLIDKATGKEKDDYTKQAEGLSVMLSEILLKQGKYEKAKDFFENLLIPTEGAKERVKELLLQQEHTEATLRELMSKIRPVPSFMEGLARAYKELGHQEDLLRALTLLGILSKADVKKQYTPPWWKWQLLIQQIYYEYGVSFRDMAALDNVLKKHKQYNDLGLLDNSGLKPEFEKIRTDAQREKSKLGG